ncbi:class I tRNA ligase family protein [Areca yellow leaf disease phytoplasma]|uniref:class I tRNA ligase family protein n=1 Tax=Areca yellow leaf disease phytoplasma TaxID=927614 RepID=UPI0035B545AB
MILGFLLLCGLSILGWPNCNAPLFKNRFPTDVLVTGYDILTFGYQKWFFKYFINPQMA